jgi:hypothetical protein
MRLLCALALALVLSGCVRAAGTRCERVCRMEAECVEKLQALDYATAGCVEACAELERDPATQRLVEEHMRCVIGARTCAEVLACQ